VFLLAALLILGALGFLVASVDAGSMQIDREKKTRAALAQAKQALIARAALDVNRPGSLPCPARDLAGIAPAVTGIPGDPCNPSISTPTTGSNRNYLVGRLPWSTLGLPRLLDAGGEQLWYAVSDEFRDVAANRINSDTQGSLVIKGETPASKVVAVVFAPGAPLPGQDRDPANAAKFTDPSNYLEGENNVRCDPPGCGSGENDFEFEMRTRDGTFNDTLIFVTHAELMEVVENALEARLRTLILPRLRTYYADWSAFPYAAPFDPTTTSVDARTSPPATQGLLPLALASGSPAQLDLRWRGGPYKARLSNGTEVGDCGYPGGSAADDPPYPPWAFWLFLSVSDPSKPVICKIRVASAPSTVTINFEVAEVGFGLVEPPRSVPDTDVKPSSSVITSQAFTYSVLANGRGVITVDLVVNTTNWVVFALQRPTQVDLTHPSYDWLIQNRWYQQVLYAIPPNMAPGGGSTCSTTATANCLTVQRRTGTNEAASVALVLAGRPALRESPPSASCAIEKRPAWDPNPTPGCPEALAPANYLQNYFESVNNDADTTLPIELREGYRSPTFNDRVVWLSAVNATPATGRPKMECAPWLCE